MLSLNRITPLNNPNLFSQLMAEFRNFISLPSIKYDFKGQAQAPGDVSSISYISCNQELMGTSIVVGISYVDKLGEPVYEEFTLEEGFSPGGKGMITFRKNISPI